jgi:CheY-like chemotaxis protein
MRTSVPPSSRGAGADGDASRKCVDELSTLLDRVGLRAEIVVRPPLSDIDETTAAPPLRGAATTGGARRIVLVEDNDDLREGFRAVLADLGHDVKEACDGPEGLAIILAEKPDVAIIDIGLRGMNGYEVARQVRAALGHSVLLVAMTGYERESDRLEALSAGFDLHMTKPVDIELVERMLGPGQWNEGRTQSRSDTCT